MFLWLTGSLAWLFISIAFFISMLAIDECRQDFMPYAMIFALLHIIFFLSLVLYFAKMLLYDSFISWPFVLASILLGFLILGFGIFMMGYGIFFTYGAGFDNACQTLYTLSAIINVIVSGLMILGSICPAILGKKEEIIGDNEKETLTVNV